MKKKVFKGLRGQLKKHFTDLALDYAFLMGFRDGAVVYEKLSTMLASLF